MKWIVEVKFSKPLVNTTILTPKALFGLIYGTAIV